MYNLYKIEEDRYQIHSTVHGVKSMEGTLLGILTYCTNVLHFEIKELETALLDLIYNENEYDAAHFGINRTYMYPFFRYQERAS